MKKVLLPLLGLASIGTASADVHMLLELKNRTVIYNADDVVRAKFEEIDDVETGVWVTGSHKGYDYVDLGLESEIMWATYNLGATKLDDCGKLYAWGETESRKRSDLYSWSTYKWSTGPGEESLTKYCIDKKFSLTLTSDGLYELLPEDDAATANWGGDWRTPSLDEVNELKNSCTWLWVDNYNNSGLDGLVGTSKINENIIFFPLLVEKDKENDKNYTLRAYWTSEIFTGRTSLANSYGIEDVGKNAFCCTYMDTRYVPLGVRAVHQGERKPAGTYFVVYLTNGDKDLYYADDVITMKYEGNIPVSGETDGYEYVDLGLPSGLKWATKNVKASSPEDVGGYYSWGETSTKEEYSEITDCHFNMSVPDLKENGILNEEGKLYAKYDAAAQNWSENWRMPTQADFTELRTNCTWTWTSLNNVKGYKVTSNKLGNDNWIFLPATGSYIESSECMHVGTIGYYWCSTPHESSNNLSCYFYFNNKNENFYYFSRYYGLTIRPVTDSSQK
ncbi:MAG: hypothetical protein MJZ19_06555 [Paludibacteraceae bacterium]|nr:hypothetical protein [Paludibacteraceae bacterium]